jgi:glycerol-3-phosphate dehydrogenase (NAD(P)+)
LAKITILGAGVMGSAFAIPAVDNGHMVHLVGTHLDDAWVDSVAATGWHPKLRCHLPAGVRAFRNHQLPEAIGEDTDLICLGVNSAGIEWGAERLCAVLERDHRVIMITKGLRPHAQGFETFPNLVANKLRAADLNDSPVAAVAGPCIAGELAARRESGVVFTHGDPAYLDWLQGVFANDRYYFVRTSTDVDGVEACAAWKNFYALAIGVPGGYLAVRPAAENAAAMHNPTANLFAQAITEMRVLTEFMGGSIENVLAMPGTGDLYVTCQGGRNSRMGRRLGAGELYSEIMAGPMHGETVEGAELALAIGPTLDRLCDDGRLPARQLPLARAVVRAISQDQPLDLPWQAFHTGLSPAPAART